MTTPNRSRPVIQPTAEMLRFWGITLTPEMARSWLITITPEMVNAWIKHNTHNRPIREKHVGSLTREITTQRWVASHQGICLACITNDTDGTVTGAWLDGQHRLLGIVKADMPVQMLVSFAPDLSTQDVVDLGLAARNIGDILHLQDGLDNATLKCGACRQIQGMCGITKGVKTSVGLTRFILDQVHREIAFVIQSTGQFRPGSRAWVVGVLAFCLAADSRCSEFISKFGSGLDLKRGEPVKALRDWFLNRDSRHLMPENSIASQCVCNAAYNSISGQEQNIIKPGARGMDFFAAKNRELVRLIRIAAGELDLSDGTAAV